LSFFLRIRLNKNREILHPYCIDRFELNAKRCHACELFVDKRSLSVRMRDCPQCGTRHDRDINAANPLENLINFLIFNSPVLTWCYSFMLFRKGIEVGSPHAHASISAYCGFNSEKALIDCGPDTEDKNLILAITSDLPKLAECVSEMKETPLKSVPMIIWGIWSARHWLLNANAAGSRKRKTSQLAIPMSSIFSQMDGYARTVRHLKMSTTHAYFVVRMLYTAPTRSMIAESARITMADLWWTMKKNKIGMTISKTWTRIFHIFPRLKGRGFLYLKGRFTPLLDKFSGYLLTDAGLRKVLGENFWSSYWNCVRKSSRYIHNKIPEVRINIRGSVNTAPNTDLPNEATKSKLVAVYFQIWVIRLGNEIVSTKKCPIIEKNFLIARSLMD